MPNSLSADTIERSISKLSVTSSNFTDDSEKSTHSSAATSIQTVNTGMRTHAVCTSLKFDILSQYVLFASRQTPLPTCAASHVIQMGHHCTKGVGTK